MAPIACSAAAYVAGSLVLYGSRKSIARCFRLENSFIKLLIELDIYRFTVSKVIVEIRNISNAPIYKNLFKIAWCIRTKFFHMHKSLLNFWWSWFII